MAYFRQITMAAFAAFGITVATTATAQDLCGGTGTGGVWIGGTEAASDIATADQFREQMALVLGSNQYVALFSLTAPTEVRVEAAGRGSGDPIIDLLDAGGALILSDDDSGGNAAARAETMLDAGTYCLALRGYDGGPMTAFVRIGRLDQEPLTDGPGVTPATDDTAGCTSAVAMDGIGGSMVTTASETPYLQFTLDAPTAISITAVSDSADPAITLFGPDEAYIAENDDFDGLNSRINVTAPLQPGDYCLNLRALSSDSAAITVAVSEYDAAAALAGLFARGEAAPPLDGSVAITDLGTVTSRQRHDIAATTDVSWFTADIAAPGLLLVEAIGGASTDPWLVVYDDLGRQVGQNDDYANTSDSLVVVRAQPGTYIIGVRQYDGGAGLVRLLLERYVSAE